jgi:hypothetical protein
MEEEIKLQEYFTDKTLQIIDDAKSTDSENAKWNRDMIKQSIHFIFQNNDIPLPIAISTMSDLLATYLMAKSDLKRISFQNSSRIN